METCGLLSCSVFARKSTHYPSLLQHMWKHRSPINTFFLFLLCSDLQLSVLAADDGELQQLTIGTCANLVIPETYMSLACT